MNISRCASGVSRRRCLAFVGIVCVGVVVVCYVLQLQPREKPASDKVSIPKTGDSNMVAKSIVQDLTLKVIVPFEVVAATAVEAEIALRNNSKSPVTVHVGHSLTPLRIEIVGSDRAKVPLSKRGAEVFPSGLFGGSSGPVTLVEPSGVLSWKVDLSDLFELRRGRNHVTVSINVTTARGEVEVFKVTSKSAEFMVK